MNRRLMKAGEKNYLKESNGTKANCNANVTQVWKSRIYNQNSDSDDFQKDWYAKECNPATSVRFDFKSCRN